MTGRTPYMQSNYPRRAGDHYPTIDTRCVDGLLHYFGDQMKEAIGVVDMCADQGSAIVDYLQEQGFYAWGAPDAFADSLADPSNGFVPAWGVTNPPYKIGVVQKIMERQIARVRQQFIINGGLLGFAALMRTQFDHSSEDYRAMFESPFYWGQIKLCFRPFWTDDRSMTPFHNHVWHIWLSERTGNDKHLRHYYAPYDPQYAVISKKKRKKNNA